MNRPWKDDARVAVPVRHGANLHFLGTGPTMRPQYSTIPPSSSGSSSIIAKTKPGWNHIRLLHYVHDIRQTYQGEPHCLKQCF